MLQSVFDDVRRMNKRQVNCFLNNKHHRKTNLSTYGDSNKFAYCNTMLFAVFVSSTKFWHDSFVSANDMERSDGCDWQREPYCSGIKVHINLTLFYYF